MGQKARFVVFDLLFSFSAWPLAPSIAVMYMFVLGILGVA
jgi:hypothetical protein